MRKLSAILAAIIGCTTAMAMPTDQEMEKVQPVIEELARDAFNAMKAGKMTRGQFAETMLGYLADADTEAAKVVLIRQAFRQLMLAGATDKAVEAYALLDANVSDVPAGTFGAWCAPFVAALAKGDKANDLAVLLERAFDSGDAESASALYKQLQPNLRKLSAAKNGGARLAAVAGRFAGLERRKNEARNLRAALRGSPDDVALREKYGLCLVALGDWKAALKEFAQTGGRLAEVAVWENTRPEPGDSPLTAADVAAFWWAKADAIRDAEVAAALRGHAAGWYQAAVDGGELSGLKKTLAEKRIAEVAKTGEVAAVGGADADTGKPIVIPMGKGVEMELVPIPAGKFTMGWDNVTEYWKHTFFPHQVTITRPFWMGKFPVTLEQWECLEKRSELSPNVVQWVSAWGNNVPMACFGAADNVDRFLDQLNQKFKRFLPQGYVFRLPTMAEWEYACRANGDPEKDICAMQDTDGRISREEFEKHFVTLEERREMAKRKGLSLPDERIAFWPVAAGTKPPNPWGLFDMMGNYAGELTMDRFPASTPIPWDSRGPFLPKTIDWNGMDVDPLFWDDGNQAVGSFIEAGLHFSQSDKKPKNVIFLRRLFRSRKKEDARTGFRVVIGPDLVGEWKQKAKAK
ncbi:MAG: formylglycine-generating enzyme family protein [Kiritimatiellae bacterium]|nr:formylglycine-generating enzyme family protein [Kiritimatiellia bacterium]